MKISRVQKNPKHQIILRFPLEKELLTPSEIAQRLVFPKNVLSDFKALVYLSQPRGASTAIAAAWGSWPWLKGKVHFQPWKYLQRYAKRLNISSLNLVKPDQRFVGLKETPGGPNFMSELFDPIDILLQAGLARKHLRVIVAGRHPLWQFESWLKFDTRRRAEVFLAGQKYVFAKTKEYIKKRIKTVPFITELYCGQDVNAMRALFTALGLDDNECPVPDKLTFKDPKKNVIWHEADPRIDPHYYENVVADVVRANEFRFPKPKLNDTFEYIPKYISKEMQKALWTVAVPRYIKFAEYTVKYLYQKTGFRNQWFEEDFLPQVRHYK